jgi:rare lipoprotein A
VVRVFKLAEARRERSGLYCGRDGVYLGSAALIECRGGRYWLRAEDEVAALLAAAYEPPPDASRIVDGLCEIAFALAANEPSRAMIAALQLRLEAIPAISAARIAAVDLLSKFNFNPAEPRDRRGRWTRDEAAGTITPIGDRSPGSARTETSDTRQRLDPGSHSISGTASWYYLPGRRMANGQLFDPNAMSAAMLNVPLGAVATVQLAEDPSRSITVTITDRGPYAVGRVIDLTKTAFKALAGSTSVGLVNVIVTLP